MANQVVVPFPGSKRTQFERSTSSSSSSLDGWRSERRPVRRVIAETIARQGRSSRLLSRLSTARDVVRAVFETLSYLGEARVRPPSPPALPAARLAK